MTHARTQHRSQQPNPTRRTLRSSGRTRLIAAALATMALVAGGTACSGSGSTDSAGNASASAKAEVFGPKGYRGVGPGTAKDAALAGGSLQSAPLSALTGCTLFSYHDGPAPDPAVLAAEREAVAKSKDTDAKAKQARAEADGKRPGPGASAQEYAEDAARSAETAKLFAAATTAIADELKLQATRDKAFEAAGGAKFGTTGLKQLIAPPKARTAEGIGTGSTEAELKKAYPAIKATDGGFELPVDGAPGWELFFAVGGDKVTAMSLFSTTVKCL